MTLLYILFFVAILICVILILPLKIVVAYDESHSVAVKLLFFKKQLISKKDKDEKEKPTKKTKTKKSTKKAPEEKKQSKSMTAAEIIKLLKDVIKPLTDKFFGYLRIDHYNVKVVIATEDAAATALLYGAASAALFSLLSALETIKPSRRSITGKNKSNAQIIPDFTTTKLSVNAHIIFSLRVWQFIYCALRGSREFLLFNKSRKT